MKLATWVILLGTVLSATLQTGSASDHIYVEVEPGETIGAGFGELTPGPHNLKFTAQAPSGKTPYGYAFDDSGHTTWSLITSSSSTETHGAEEVIEDQLNVVWYNGYLHDANDPEYYEYAGIAISNALFPCAECNYNSETGYYDCPYGGTYGPVPYCEVNQEGVIRILPGGGSMVTLNIYSGVGGTLTFQGDDNDLEVQHPNGTPFTSASVGTGHSWVLVKLQTSSEFDNTKTLTCLFEHNNGPLDSQDILLVVEDVPISIDIDVDSNNDGTIAAGNQLTEDEYEHLVPGKVLPVIDATTLARITIQATTGEITLSSTFPAAILQVSDGEALILPKTWDLDNGEMPPNQLTLIPLGRLDDNPDTPLGHDRTKRGGKLKLEHDGGTFDEVYLTLVVPPSRSPKNNQASFWEPFQEFNTASSVAIGHTQPLGYDWRHYRDSVTFLNMFDDDEHIELDWANFKVLGREGLLVIATHGGADEDGAGIAVIWREDEQGIRDFLNIAEGDPLPTNTFILDFSLRRLGEENPIAGKLLVVTPSWIQANWKSDRDSNRSIGLFLACYSAVNPDGPEHSVIDSAGGAASFGYEGECNEDYHETDTDLLLGRMASDSATPSRAAGPVYGRGGFTDVPATETEPAVRFTLSILGDYWVTLCPAHLIHKCSLVQSQAPGKQLGFACFVTDTKRDESVTPGQAMTKTGGTGQVTLGPYNIAQAPGCGCEYILDSEQTLQLHTSNQKIYDDEVSKKLWLYTNLTWNIPGD